MRFRAKFGLASWAWLVVALFAALLIPSHPHRLSGAVPLNVGIYVVIALWQVLAYFFIWWDVTPTGLHERRLWSSRTVAWSEITRVGSWPNEAKPSNSVAIHFFRPGPLSAAGQVIASPADRREFLAAIRGHAPGAVVDLAVSASPVPGSLTL